MSGTSLVVQNDLILISRLTCNLFTNLTRVKTCEFIATSVCLSLNNRGNVMFFNLSISTEMNVEIVAYVGLMNDRSARYDPPGYRVGMARPSCSAHGLKSLYRSAAPQRLLVTEAIARDCELITMLTTALKMCSLI